VTDVCSHGRPDHQELVRELREAVGLFAGAMPVTPKAAWEEAVERAGLLPAALDVIARSAWQFNEAVSLLREARDHIAPATNLLTELDEGLPEIQSALEALAALVKDLVEDRQP
jgi:hypothetical protein